MYLVSVPCQAGGWALGDAAPEALGAQGQPPGHVALAGITGDPRPGGPVLGVKPLCLSHRVEFFIFGQEALHFHFALGPTAAWLRLAICLCSECA